MKLEVRGEELAAELETLSLFSDTEPPPARSAGFRAGWAIGLAFAERTCSPTDI